jgi:plastocyanin
MRERVILAGAAGLALLLVAGGGSYLLLHAGSRTAAPQGSISPAPSTPGLVAEVSPSPTEEVTPAPAATPTATPTATPAIQTPTPTPVVHHATPTPVRSSTPTPVPTPTPTPTVAPTPTPSPPPSPTPAPTPTPVTCSATGSAVQIVSFQFMPSSLCVAPGTTVTWTQEDATAHTVTSTGSNWSKDSGALSQNATFSVTFDTPGVYSYWCAFHHFMLGTVKVTGQPPAPRNQPLSALTVRQVAQLLSLNDLQSGCRCCCEDGCC